MHINLVRRPTRHLEQGQERRVEHETGGITNSNVPSGFDRKTGFAIRSKMPSVSQPISTSFGNVALPFYIKRTRLTLFE